jgi:capsular exopolysaccharide synthesis family protein
MFRAGATAPPAACAPEAAGNADHAGAARRQQVTFAPEAAAPRDLSRPSALPTIRSGADTLVVSANASVAAVEQYRRIAVALQDIQRRSEWAGPEGLGRGLRTVVVTSAVHREGKTLTAINLALTLSEHYGCRVLVIDADLRNAAVHDVLGLSNLVGLTDILRSGLQRIPLQEVSSRLSVLPAGRAALDPSNLGSDRMRTLLRDAASAFDWILVDAPPVGRGPDARLLARLSRAVLFVIATGATPYPVVERAMSEIGRGSVIGAVLNQVPNV